LTLSEFLTLQKMYVEGRPYLSAISYSLFIMIAKRD